MDSPGDSLRIEDWHESSKRKYSMDTFGFADGSIVHRDVLIPDAYRWTDGDDVIRSGYEADNLSGGLGNDTLQGEGGADTLLGGEGDDILEGGSSGDTLEGGTGNDTLEGGSGDDHLTGGLGDDYLAGGSDDDTYYFGYGDGHDTIRDYSYGDTDQVNFVDGISKEDLWFTQQGNDLKVDVIGSSDSLVVSDWYDNSRYQIDEFHTDSAQLHRNQVDQLVNAMAAFDVPDGVGAVVPDDVRQQLEPTLTSVWQVS